MISPRDKEKFLRDLVTRSPGLKMIGDKVDLSKFPNITHCNGDGGPYISSGITIIKDPDTGITNMGIYRLQIKSKNKLGVGIGKYAHGDYIMRKAEEKNKGS
jgi:2,5-furandicarboxylate decarboxylase 1